VRPSDLCPGSARADPSELLVRNLICLAQTRNIFLHLSISWSKSLTTLIQIPNSSFYSCVWQSLPTPPRQRTPPISCEGAAMSTSPSKLSAPHLPPVNLPSTLQPSSPRAQRTIRRLQSAHTLSSNASSANSPSLISQQRQQQQQRHGAGNHRDPLPTQNLSIPATRTHHRSRSNSDAAVTSITPSGPVQRRNAAAKRVVAPGVSVKHQLEVLIREGPPRGDITEGLRDLRYFVLSDGVDADHDGMVRKTSIFG